MKNSRAVLGLDVGARRIGVAKAELDTKLAVPLKAVLVDGTEFEQLQAIIDEYTPVVIVVGYPRNQSGDATAQTAIVESFASRLGRFKIDIAFQDESLTSVIAEERLRQRGSHTKADIDAEAAAIILQDYIEIHYGYTTA